MRLRARSLRPDNLQGATFTVSSLGNIGGTGFTPIVNAPEVAITWCLKSDDQAGLDEGCVRTPQDSALVVVLRPSSHQWCGGG